MRACVLLGIALLQGCGGGNAEGAPAPDDEPPTEDAGTGPDAASLTPDSGTRTDAAPSDAGAGPEPDTAAPPAQGPCVEYVKAPASPGWVAWAHYGASDVPSYCGDAVTGNSCRYAMINAGARLDATGSYILYPYPAGACRINVPTKCLPCTGNATQW